ncbi:MAG: phytoene/squalene synthase family protein [Candidatus Acidiferrales bacterium]
MPDNFVIAASYEHCRKVARSAAKNFYYGFRLLPREKHDALCALYAFMRGADDISDSPGDLEEKRRRLAKRRAEMDRALAGDFSADPVWPAFRHSVERFGIPPRYFHDLISGTEMDLTVETYETFERLREYCYRVAGTVGLCCVHVFGFSDPCVPELAESLGIAFQLTNILRDIPRDLELGRTYIPGEDLARFGLSSLARTAECRSKFRALMEFEADRAWDFYRRGWPLLSLVSEDSRAALWALARIYSGILEKIEARAYDVFSPPAARLSAGEKIWILARARLGLRDHNHELGNRDSDRRRAGGTFLRRRAG